MPCAHGVPYWPAATAAPAALPAPRSVAPQKVTIALCATAMKLKPRLLAACAQIAARASVGLHFHLLLGQVQEFSDKFKLAPDSVRPMEVARFLGDWLTHHIHQVDMKYAGFLKEKGLK